MKFHTENIVLITFSPGEGGHAIGQILSMSREFHTPTRDDIDKKQFLKTGRAHFNKLFNIRKKQTADDAVWENIKEFKEETLAQVNEVIYDESIIYAVPIHAKLGVARRVFTNAPAVVIFNSDTRQSVRAQYEKVYKTMMPDVEDGFIVWGDTRHSKDTSVARQKNVLRTLILSTNNRREYNRVRRHVLEANEVVITVALDRDKLLSDDWEEEYKRLCDRLRITPDFESVGRYLEAYKNYQWKRKILPV